MHRHVVNFSGGVPSWATARRVAERHGTENLTLLFADTKSEDEDLYRFLDEAAADVGAPLVRLVEGRTIWQVFRDERFLGNSRVDPCSKILKRQTLDAWTHANCDPAATTIYLGYDWTEAHRLVRSQERMAPWRIEAPMTEEPIVSVGEMHAQLRARGIRPPRLYDLGFRHNNCGGGCIKAGHAQFMHLLKALPERFAEWERGEQGMRDFLGKDVSMLKDRRGGTTKPLTLRMLRERVEHKQLDLLDPNDWGACSCFAPPPDEVG